MGHTLEAIEPLAPQFAPIRSIGVVTSLNMRVAIHGQRFVRLRAVTTKSSASRSFIGSITGRDHTRGHGGKRRRLGLVLPLPSRVDRGLVRAKGRPARTNSARAKRPPIRAIVPAVPKLHAALHRAGRSRELCDRPTNLL